MDKQPNPLPVANSHPLRSRWVSLALRRGMLRTPSNTAMIPLAGSEELLGILSQHELLSQETTPHEKPLDAGTPDMAENEHRDYEHRVSTTEAERIAISAAKLATNDALNEIFTLFGVNRANFDSVEEFKENMRFLRQLCHRKEVMRDLDFVQNLRGGAATTGKRFGLALVVIMAGAFAVGMGNALKDWLKFIVMGK